MTLWTVAHQVPLSMKFSRQEYWSGLPIPSPGDLPDTGIEPWSPAWAGKFLSTEPPGKPINQYKNLKNCCYLANKSQRCTSAISLQLNSSSPQSKLVLQRTEPSCPEAEGLIECGPPLSSCSIIWNLVRNANSRVPSQTYCVRISGCEAQSTVL